MSTNCQKSPEIAKNAQNSFLLSRAKAKKDYSEGDFNFSSQCGWLNLENYFNFLAIFFKK